MTAPTKNRSDVNVVGSRDQSVNQTSTAQADNLAAERATHLRNEIFAKGVLPAL